MSTKRLRYVASEPNSRIVLFERRLDSLSARSASIDALWEGISSKYVNLGNVYWNTNMNYWRRRYFNGTVVQPPDIGEAAYVSTIEMVSAIMRAIRVSEFGGPEALKLEENVPKPKPSETQVLMRLRACGINPVDTYIRSGTHAIKPSLPYIPGADGAGIVEAVGEKVRNFKPGDNVYVIRPFSGTYAEYAVAEEKMVAKLDDNLTFEQGAALGIPYYTAYGALIFLGKARPGQTVLIHGASGGVGTAACQIARAYGLQVLGTAGTVEGKKVVMQNGADAVFDHTEPGYLEKVQNLTGGEGPDVILEMLANVNLGMDLGIIKKHGTIVVIGNRGTVEINPRLCMNKRCIITGFLLMNSTEAEWSEMQAAFNAGMRAGWLRPQIGQIFSLSEASQAHEQVMMTTGKTGKIVLKI